MAQQQAKIARIEQEIQEAQAGQCLDSVPASTKAQESIRQITPAAESALQQQHLQSHLTAHSPSATAQTHVQSEHNSQPQLTASMQNTDVSDNARDDAAHQSMWL